MQTAQEQDNGTEIGRPSDQQNGGADGMYISLSQAAKRWGKQGKTSMGRSSRETNAHDGAAFRALRRLEQENGF
jgi:hypothetical protein